MNIANRALRSFLWRTGLGRSAAEKFWKKRSTGSDLRYLIYNQARILPDLPINFDEEIFNQFLLTDLGNWEIQDGVEYILEADDILVEPERCLGTKGLNELIEQTVVFKAHYQYPYVLPHLLHKGSATHLEKAVLYDGSASRNLYHHLVETVGRLSLLERAGLPKDIPVIVNRFAYNTSFFQYLFHRSPFFRSFNWRIQEPNEWLKVKKLYRPKSYYFGRDSWDFTRKLYNLEEVVPHRRVFLSRDKKKFTRGLSNETEVAAMLSKHGFETTYAEHMTVDEQVKMFQETEYLVALTGMGVIQQFFMKYDKAHVIEIIPANRLMPEYYCQAYSLGIKYYDVVLGEDLDKEAAQNPPRRYDALKEYDVNVVKLEAAVLKMLNAPADKRVYGRTQMPM